MLDKKDLKEIKGAVDNSVNNLAIIVKRGFDSVDKRFDKVEGRLTKVEGRLTKVGTTMVTKNYLDDKLSDLRGDLVVLMRKEDNKLRTLVEILKERKVITKKDEERILTMEPFPELGPNLKTV